jgi:hypothetical protein
LLPIWVLAFSRSNWPVGSLGSVWMHQRPDILSQFFDSRVNFTPFIEQRIQEVKSIPDMIIIAVGNNHKFRDQVRNAVHALHR